MIACSQHVICVSISLHEIVRVVNQALPAGNGEIGDASVRFPVRLLAGQRLVCRDHAAWRVLGANGDEVASGNLSGAFPPLAPGANRIALTFEKEACRDFRVSVKTAKVY